MLPDSIPLDRRQLAQALAAAFPLGEAVQDQPAPKPPTPAEALTGMVRQRYEEHLTPEQLKLIQGSIARGLATAERMKKIPLKNGDEPAFVFRADLP